MLLIIVFSSLLLNNYFLKLSLSKKAKTVFKSKSAISKICKNTSLLPSLKAV
jgi:hypothetical protein